MKKTLIFIAACSIVMLSCSSKHESMIRDYMEKTVKVPGSYQPISTTELDSAFATPMVDDEYLALDSIAEALRMKSMELLDKDIDNFDSVRVIMDSLDEKRKELVKMQEEYLDTHSRGRFIGFACDHEFTAKNELGVDIRNVVRVLFDSEMSRIIDVTTK